MQEKLAAADSVKLAVYGMAALYLLILIAAFVVFPTVYIINVIQYNTLGNPLNKNHPAFKFTTMVDIGTRWTIKNAFLSYRVFLLVPVLFLGCSAWFTYKYIQSGEPLGSKQIMTIVLAWAIPLVIIGATAGVLGLVRLLVRNDIRAINGVNTFIYSHMYNAPAFKVLATPDIDRLQQIQTYVTLLNRVLEETKNDDKQATKFAKALFTVNLYLTYYEIGIRHDNVDDAISMFKHMKRFTSNNFADFLSPKTVFVQNRISEIMSNIRDDPKSRQMRLEAKTLSGQWVTELNAKIGSISYASASMAFIVITLSFFVIYGTPIALLLKFMRCAK